MNRDRSVTEDRIKNSLKRKLSSYVEYRGAARNGGYYLKERTENEIGKTR